MPKRGGRKKKAHGGGNEHNSGSSSRTSVEEVNERMRVVNLDTGEIILSESQSAMTEVVTEVFENAARRASRQPSGALNTAELAEARATLNTFEAHYPDADVEFNSDPQYAIFGDHYDQLVKQEEGSSVIAGDINSYVCADESADGGKGNQSLLSLLSQAVGEMTSITIPIGYMESLSFLQRLCEPYVHAHLLDQAAADPDPVRRHALVTSFFVSAHRANVRLFKPFNPLLGETFEYISDGTACSSKFRFLAEQVSHHPPIAAAVCRGNGWYTYEEKRVSSHFGGNSLTLKPLGTLHVILSAHNEEYLIDAVNCCVHNVIMGSMYVDHYGETTVTCRALPTDDGAAPADASYEAPAGASYETRVRMEAIGWLSKNRYVVTADIVRADGAGGDNGDDHDDDGGGKRKGKKASKLPAARLHGKWNASLTLSRTDSDDAEQVLWNATEEDERDEKAQAEQPKHLLKFALPAFSVELCRIEDVRLLPPTDSRLRFDRMLLEQGAQKAAGAAKHKLEVRQRQAKKERLRLELDWFPRFFRPAPPDAPDPHEWTPMDYRYWHQREHRLRRGTHKRRPSKRKHKK